MSPDLDARGPNCDSEGPKCDTRTNSQSSTNHQLDISQGTSSLQDLLSRVSRESGVAAIVRPPAICALSLLWPTSVTGEGYARKATNGLNAPPRHRRDSKRVTDLVTPQSNRNQVRRTSRNSLKYREPLVGFEPTTARLRIESSTPELQWLVSNEGARLHAPPLWMPWRGFEPRRLSALPPQDSVSTSFTTRACGGQDSGRQGGNQPPPLRRNWLSQDD
jgi:hypothetical protein